MKLDMRHPDIMRRTSGGGPLILPGNREGEGARNALEKSNLPNGVKAFLGTLVQSQSRGILARSDTTALEFGKELPENERRWIHAVIMRMMTS